MGVAGKKGRARDPWAGSSESGTDPIFVRACWSIETVPLTPPIWCESPDSRAHEGICEMQPPSCIPCATQQFSVGGEVKNNFSNCNSMKNSRSAQCNEMRAINPHASGPTLITRWRQGETAPHGTVLHNEGRCGRFMPSIEASGIGHQETD